MQPGNGPRPKPEIRSVAVSGMVMTFQPSSGLNSFRMREIRVVLPAAQDYTHDLFSHDKTSSE